MSGFETPPFGKENLPAMLTPQNFAAKQLASISAFVPQLFLSGVGLYFLAGAIRKVTNALGLTKSKEK